MRHTYSNYDQQKKLKNTFIKEVFGRKIIFEKAQKIVRVTAPFCCLLLVLHWNAVTETIFSIERSSLSFSWHPDKAVPILKKTSFFWWCCRERVPSPKLQKPTQILISEVSTNYIKLQIIILLYPKNIQACWIIIVAIGHDTSLVNHVERIQTWFSYSFGQDCS